MQWIVVAAVGIAVILSVAFWQQIVTWANQKLAGWLSDLFGAELRDAFLLLLAGADRAVVFTARALTILQERLIRARLIFRRLQGGQQEKVIQLEVQADDGTVVTHEAAEVVDWHELPDDVREKFIRRQMAEVTMELKMKE
jgi:hypothetical protein